MTGRSIRSRVAPHYSRTSPLPGAVDSGRPGCAKVCKPAGFGGCVRLAHRDVAQLGRALDWGSRGRGFKSRRPDYFSNASSPCTAAVQQYPRKTLKVCIRSLSGRHAAGGFKITTLGRSGFASRVLRVVRHQRQTSLTASLGCWHAYPVGVSAVLTLAPGSSPWRLQSAHGGTPLTSRTVTAGPGCGARDPPCRTGEDARLGAATTPTPAVADLASGTRRPRAAAVLPAQHRWLGEFSVVNRRIAGGSPDTRARRMVHP